MTNNLHIGSSLDSFLEEEDILVEINAAAIKKVLAWQVSQEMDEKGFSKTEMATAMKTSRTSLERLLDPSNISISLKTMARAAAAVGKRLKIDLVDNSEYESIPVAHESPDSIESGAKQEHALRR